MKARPRRKLPSVKSTWSGVNSLRSIAEWKTIKLRKAAPLAYANSATVTAALRPADFAHPRSWDLVPWPEKHQAFEAWFATTKLNALYALNPATEHLAVKA